MNPTVAIIQAQPEYYNLPACIEKAHDLIQEAASKRAQFITFGETWFPGYPVWLDYGRDVTLWDNPQTKDLFATLYHNSMTVPGPELESFQSLAKQLEITLVLSINERVEGEKTLYNSLLTIGHHGNLANHHRKLMPTYTERIVWGMGDGSGLKAVDTPVGKIGGLICWEHWMPLARQAVHQTGEQIHVAVWPTVNERHQLASRHYAIEGRTFVLAAGSILPADALPDKIELQSDGGLLQRGGSAIIGPDGRYVAGPIYEEETILVAQLDMDMIIKEAMTLDVTGHYARPDIFDFRIIPIRRSDD
jgi:nitrilase